MNAHDRAWLSAYYAPGLGPVRVRALLQRYGQLSVALEAPTSHLAELGIPLAALERFTQPDTAQLERAATWLAQPNHHLLHWEHPDYPMLLQQIPDPPLVLFVNGDVQLLSMPQLAVVGSRHPSKEGLQNARAFASYLANAGLVVTSGLALGIDAAAHQGALEGGRTIAVLGTGPDRVYPARHHELAHRIVQQGGALVSEFPPGTAPAAENFPRRNRVISGLALGVLVVEAARRSGSLISARLALEQGREVFAIPGSIHNPLARGCHALIRQGAKLVETGQDIAEELGALVGVLLAEADLDLAAFDTETLSTEGSVRTRRNRATPSEQRTKPDSNSSTHRFPVLALDSEQQQLLTLLEPEPCAIDTLVLRSGLTPDAVSSMLLILELQGYVIAHPGGFYSRAAS